MAVSCDPEDQRYSLRSGNALVWEVVAGWVGSSSELEQIAPTTQPPLDAAKVRAWTGPGDSPLVYWDRLLDQPVAYGELNPMGRRRQEYWIGHVVVSPVHRGRGIGTNFVRAVLRRAFDALGARRVRLVVRLDNAAAVRCYLKAGMTPGRIEIQRFEGVPRVCRMLQMSMTYANFENCWGTPGHRAGLPAPVPLPARAKFKHF